MKITKARNRSRNLTDADIAIIVDVLDGWKGPLTWEALIESISSRLNTRYTRQALHQHERIRLAFLSTKVRIKEGGRELDLTNLSPAELRVFADRYSRLIVERDRLEKEYESLLEQFVVWAYNAHTRGLDEAFLNRPIPSVDRARTKTRTKR